MFLEEITMRKYNKEYQTPEQYIEKISEENFQISNKKMAVDIVSTFGYEHIKAYVDSFKNDDSSFRSDVEFIDVLGRYRRDFVFRNIIFSHSVQFEIFFKSCFVEVLAEKYGTHPYEECVFKDKESFDDFKNFFRVLVKKSKDERIKRYKKNFDIPKLPPVWDLVHISTFGQVNRWFNFLSVTIQSEISHRMGISKIKFFRSWLGTIVELRNESAHGGVLFNIKLKNKPGKLRINNNGEINFIPSGSNYKLKSGVEVLNFLLNLRSEIMGLGPYPSVVNEIEEYFLNFSKTEKNNSLQEDEERDLSGF